MSDAAAAIKSNALIGFLRRIAPVIEVSLEENIDSSNESKSVASDNHESDSDVSVLNAATKKHLQYPMWLTGGKLRQSHLQKVPLPLF